MALSKKARSARVRVILDSHDVREPARLSAQELAAMLESKGRMSQNGGETPMILTLDELYHLMRGTTEEWRAAGLPMRDDEPDWTELPTFGGVEPRDTSEVWSWDAGRLIVGVCRDDLRIVERCSWGDGTPAADEPIDPGTVYWMHEDGHGESHPFPGSMSDEEIYQAMESEEGADEDARWIRAGRIDRS